MQKSTLRPWLAARRRSVARRLHERGNSVDTSKDVDLAELGLDHPERKGYAACGWRAIKLSLDSCDIQPTDVFVDIGCGAGRVVGQAARRDFRRVIGVEISPDLIAQAQRYVDEQRKKRAPVEFVTADATRWQLPDDVTIVFLNNPFVGSILQAVVDNVVASLERADRSMQVVYANPREPDRLYATGRFEIVKEIRQGKAGGADDFVLMRHNVKSPVAVPD
jgi:SAM-dependent methyltransferase